MSQLAGMKITIVSACRNEIGHIEALLNSIANQQMQGMDWEAIVADGMSTDGTTAFLEQYTRNHARFRVIANPGRIVWGWPTAV